MGYILNLAYKHLAKNMRSLVGWVCCMYYRPKPDVTQPILPVIQYVVRETGGIRDMTACQAEQYKLPNPISYTSAHVLLK